MDITIFTLPVCPNCIELKELLSTNNISYKIESLEKPDVYAKLLMDSVTLSEAPITRIDNKYYNKEDAIKVLGLC